MVKTTEFNIQTQMNYVVGNMSGFTAAYTGMNNLSALISSLMTSYTTMAGTGRAAYLSLGAAAAAFGLKSSEAFGEYQRGMNMVKAISNNTNAQMQMLSQSAQQFSSQFRMGIEDINSGLVTLGRAGLTDVNNQIEVLKNGLQVAKISGMDLASTLEDIVTTTSLLGGDIKSNTFGAETKEISNLLVATSLSGPLNVSDVIETLKFAGGSAAAAGATLSNEEGLHDLLGTIGAFSQKGVTGSIAGTALRAFITKPASQDQKVSDALARLGLDAYSLWEKDPEQGWHMKPIAEQIGMITKAMNDNHLTNLDRIEVWGDIVGNKMGQQMLKLDENRIKETTKDIEHQRNLEDIYQGTLTNFASQIERLNQILQAIYRNLGSGFAATLTGVVEGVADVLEFINGIANGAVFKFLATIIGPLGLAGLAKGLQDVALVVNEFKQNIKASQMTPILEQDLWTAAWGVDVKQLQKIVDRERRDRSYQERQEFDRSAENSDEYWKRWEAHQNKRDQIYYDKLNTPDPAYDARQERHMEERNRLYMEMMERVEEKKLADYRKRTDAMQQLRSQSVRADVVNLRAATLNVGQNIENKVASSITDTTQNIGKKISTNFGQIIPGTTATRVGRRGSIRAMEGINDDTKEGRNPYTGKALQRILDTEAGVRALHEVGNSLSWEEMIDPNGSSILTNKANDLFFNAAQRALKLIEPVAAESLTRWDIDAIFDDMVNEMQTSENEYYKNFFDKEGNVKADMQERFMQELMKKSIGTFYYENANLIDLEELGYSAEEAKSLLGVKDTDMISFRQLVEAGDKTAFNLASFRKKEDFVSEQNPDLPPGVLDKISDRMIFNSMGLVSQHGRVGHKMANILDGLGDGANAELTDVAKSLKKWDKTLQNEGMNTARSIVHGFLVDGFRRRSPGLIAHGTDDEFEDALKFIKEAAEKLTNAAFKLGRSIAQSFIKGVKQNSLLKTIERQFESIQILLIEQQTVLSSLMHMVATDSVLNFAMGFNTNGLPTLVRNEFGLVLQEAILFGEKFYAAMFRAGNLGQLGYKDGAGIHSPGYIYVATDEEFTAVNLLLEQETRVFKNGGKLLGQALTDWVNHLDTTKKVDQMAFGEFLAQYRDANHDYITGGNGRIGVGGTLNYLRPETARHLSAELEDFGDGIDVRRMNDDFNILPVQDFLTSKNAILGLDFETTSVNVTQSMKGYLPQIVEAGFAMINSANKIVFDSVHDFLISSEDTMTHGAKLVTGLNNDFLQKYGLSESEGYKKIVDNIISYYGQYKDAEGELIDGLVGDDGKELLLGAHNAHFDRNVLLHNLARLSYKSQKEGGLADVLFETKSGDKIDIDEAIDIIDTATWIDPDIYGEELQLDKQVANDGMNSFYAVDEKLHKVKGSHSNEALSRSYASKVKDRWERLKKAGKIFDPLNRGLHRAGYDTELMAYVIKNLRTSAEGFFGFNSTKLEQDAWKDGTPEDLATLSSERRKRLEEEGYEITVSRPRPRYQPRKNSQSFDAGAYVVVTDGKRIWSESKPQLRVRGDYGELIDQDESFDKTFNPYNKDDMSAEGEKQLAEFYQEMDDFLGTIYYEDDFSKNKTAQATERFNRKFNQALEKAFENKDIRQKWGDKFSLQTKALLLGENEDQTIADFHDFLKKQGLKIPSKEVYDYLPRIDTAEGRAMTLNPLGYAVSLMNNNTEGSQKALNSMQKNWDEMGKMNEAIIRALGGYDQVGIDILGAYGDLSVIDYQNMHNKGPYSDILQARISGRDRQNRNKYYSRKPGGYFDALPKEEQEYYGADVPELFDFVKTKNGFKLFGDDWDRLMDYDFVEEMGIWSLPSLLADSLLEKGYDVLTEKGQKVFDNALSEYDFSLDEIRDMDDYEFETLIDDVDPYIDNKDVFLRDLIRTNIEEVHIADKTIIENAVQHANDRRNNLAKKAFERYVNDQNSTQIDENTYLDDYQGKSTKVLKPTLYDKAASFFHKLVKGSPEIRDEDDKILYEAIEPRKNPLSYLMNKVNNLLGYQFWNFDNIDDIHITGTTSIISKSKNKFYQYTADQLQAMGNRIEEEFLKTFEEGAVYYSGAYQGVPIASGSYRTIDQLPIFKDLLKAHRQQTAKPYKFLEGTNPDNVRDKVDTIINTGSAEEINTLMTRHLEDASSPKFAAKKFKTRMTEIVRDALTDIYVDVGKLGLADRQRHTRKYSARELQENQNAEEYNKTKRLANDAIDVFGSNTKFQTEKGTFNKYLENIAAKNKIALDLITQAIIDEEPKTLNAMIALGMSVPKGWNEGSDSNSPPKVLTQFIQYLAEIPVKIQEQSGPIYTAMYEWGLSFVKGVKAGTQMASPPRVLTDLLTYLTETTNKVEISVGRINALLTGLRYEMTSNPDFILDDEILAQIDDILYNQSLGTKYADPLRRDLEKAKEISNANKQTLVEKETAKAKQSLVVKPNASNIDEQLLLLDVIRNQRSQRITAFNKQLGAGRFDNDKITEEMMKDLGLKAAAEAVGFKTTPGLNTAEYEAGIQNIYDKIDQGAYNSYNEIMLEVAQLNQARREGILHEQEAVRLKRMENRETKYGLLGKGLNAIGTGIPNALGKGVSALGKGMNGLMSLMMNPYIMGAEMLWGFIQQGIDMWRQQEEEKIAKLSEIASNAESSYEEQTSKWEEAQSKTNEKFGDLSDNEKQDQMLEAIQKAREDNNSASAETKALLGKQNALISSSDNMINAKTNQRLTGYKGLQANWEEFMQGSGMVGSKDEFGLMDYLEGLINPDKFKNDSNTARIQAMADATIQIDTRVKNMEEMTEDYQKVMASFGVAGRSMLDIYNVRGILSDNFFSGTFFDPNSSQRIGAPGFRSAEQLASLMKKEEKILQRFENRYLRFTRSTTGQGDRITVTLGEGSIHDLANQLGVKDVEAAQMLAVHELQRIQDVMLNQVEPQLAQTAISMYQGAYSLEQNKNLNDVQAAFQSTMTQGIFAIQAQVAQLVYKATMEQALADYQAATGDTETDTIGLLLNRARDTSYEYHDQAKQFASQGWGGFMQARDLNHLVNQGYTQEQAMNKLLEQGKDSDYYKKLYGEQLGKFEYNSQDGQLGKALIQGTLGPFLGREINEYLDFNNNKYDDFTKYTDWMMKSYAENVPLDEAIQTLNDAQTAADSEGDNGKDTDDSDANKQRYVQLAICNKKAIPKLNVNLFKKAPTFTVLNKNFKLRDIKINTADKAKNIENSLKNAIIDVQERSDPKIIQDSEGEYDPVGATDDATNLPTGASLTK